MQGDLNKSYIRNIFVGYKWKFTFQTKPLWGFATVYLAMVVWSYLASKCWRTTFDIMLFYIIESYPVIIEGPTLQQILICTTCMLKILPWIWWGSYLARVEGPAKPDVHIVFKEWGITLHKLESGNTVYWSHKYNYLPKVKTHFL